MHCWHGVSVGGGEHGTNGHVLGLARPSAPVINPEEYSQRFRTIARFARQRDTVGIILPEMVSGRSINKPHDHMTKHHTLSRLWQGATTLSSSADSGGQSAGGNHAVWPRQPREILFRSPFAPPIILLSSSSRHLISQLRIPCHLSIIIIRYPRPLCMVSC